MLSQFAGEIIWGNFGLGLLRAHVRLFTRPPLYFRGFCWGCLFKLFLGGIFRWRGGGEFLDFLGGFFGGLGVIFWGLGRLGLGYLPQAWTIFFLLIVQLGLLVVLVRVRVVWA